METLAEFKEAAHPFIKDLTKAELMVNLKASCYQCSLEIARVGGKLMIVKNRVYPFANDKTEIMFLDSYLSVLINWLENAQEWLIKLQIIGEKEAA